MTADSGPTEDDGDRPNVVLVVMDTTRGAETVPANPEITPTLAELAATGTEYTGTYATAPWTLPSHASMFTGTYPSRHGGHGNHTRLDETLPTLAELFHSAGYETAGASNNVWITEEFGFSRGFDVFYDNHDPDDREDIVVDWAPSEDRSGIVEDVLGWITGRSAERPDKGAAQTVEWVQEWLDSRRRADPFFLFVNCIEPHLEYRPPRSYAERFLPEGWTYEAALDVPQDPREYDVGLFELGEAEWAALRGLYRAEIAYLDDQLATLVEALKAADEWEDTVLVVASDHGENIGEHGFLGHQYCLFDTLLHVPLVIHGGAFSEDPGRKDGLVQLVDLPPTLADVADLPTEGAAEGFQGQSIHPAAGGPGQSRIYAEYVAPRPPVEVLEERFDEVPDRIYDLQRSLRTVRTEEFKYVRGSDGSEWLYDLTVDPTESRDVLDRRPQRAADMRRDLDEWLDTFEGIDNSKEAVSVSGATERRLSDLGYL